MRSQSLVGRVELQGSPWGRVRSAGRSATYRVRARRAKGTRAAGSGGPPIPSEPAMPRQRSRADPGHPLEVLDPPERPPPRAPRGSPGRAPGRRRGASRASPHRRRFGSIGRPTSRRAGPRTGRPEPRARAGQLDAVPGLGAPLAGRRAIGRRRRGAGQRQREEQRRERERGPRAPRPLVRTCDQTASTGPGLQLSSRGSAAPASTKAACSARTASSVWLRSITTETLISLVEISWMLMPCSRQHLEHARRDARVVLHAEPHDRHLRDLLIAVHGHARRSRARPSRRARARAR